MSFTMNWYKPPAEPELLGGSGQPLKGLLASRYANLDGSCKEEFALLEDCVPYLEGLADAGIVGARALLADLVKHKRLLVRIED